MIHLVSRLSCSKKKKKHEKRLRQVDLLVFVWFPRCGIIWSRGLRELIALCDFGLVFWVAFAFSRGGGGWGAQFKKKSEFCLRNVNNVIKKFLHHRKSNC